MSEQESLNELCDRISAVADELEDVQEQYENIRSLRKWDDLDSDFRKLIATVSKKLHKAINRVTVNAKPKIGI